MNYNDFTPQFKDSVLNELCSNLEPNCVYTGYQWNAINPDVSLMKSCLIQFKQLGIIDNLGFKNMGYCSLSINPSAYDLLRLGGFVAQEQVLKLELEKLKLELEHIESKLSDPSLAQRTTNAINIIAQIISTTTSVWSASIGK